MAVIVTDVEQDPDLFEVAYIAGHAQTVRLAYAMCGDLAIAQDLAHDAWVGAYRRQLRQPIVDVLPYVMRSVVNAARSRGRRSVLERAHLRSVRPPPAEDDAAVQLGDRAVLVVLLQQLPERMRTAVVLRVCADLSVARVAEIMGVGEGAVKSATSRGLARLRELAVEVDDG